MSAAKLSIQQKEAHLSMVQSKVFKVGFCKGACEILLDGTKPKRKGGRKMKIEVFGEYIDQDLAIENCNAEILRCEAILRSVGVPREEQVIARERIPFFKSLLRRVRKGGPIRETPKYDGEPIQRARKRAS